MNENAFMVKVGYDWTPDNLLLDINSLSEDPPDASFHLEIPVELPLFRVHEQQKPAGKKLQLKCKLKVFYC